MKYLIIMLAIVVLIPACSGPSYTVTTGPKGKKIISGSLNWNEWKKYAAWDSYDAAAYAPDDETCAELYTLALTRDVEFILFAGSWCGDCKKQLPIIYKLFRDSKLSETRIQLIGVDRKMNDTDGLAQDYNIDKVPTLVVFREGMEVGKIIETPDDSWAQDIIMIIEGMAD